MTLCETLPEANLEQPNSGTQLAVCCSRRCSLAYRATGPCYVPCATVPWLYHIAQGRAPLVSVEHTGRATEGEEGTGEVLGRSLTGVFGNLF
jgi:hypothetical protein